MASVYTTARGKNKKAKAKDQSKDFRNNCATKLNANLKDDLISTVAPTTRVADLGAGALISQRYRARLDADKALRAAAAIACSYSACTTTLSDAPAADASDAPAAGAASGVPAADAAARVLLTCPCKHAAYCDAACQRAHWLEHKAFCKEKRAELATIAALEASAREAAERASAAAVAELLEEDDDGDGDEDDA